MKDIRQIRIVKEALSKEKDKHSLEIAKVNLQIEKKCHSINTMLSYQKDYMNLDYLKLARSVPGLSKNIHLFTRKIDAVIQQAEADLELLNQSKLYFLTKLDEVNRKIDLMDGFEAKVLAETNAKQEKQEQRNIDDIVSTLEVRREYE